MVLSACDTALTARRELPHELIGLPAAFLQLGAQGVIATQWPVSDLATTLLMGRLYQHMFEDGLLLSQALRRAQFWLRDAMKGDLFTCVSGWEHANRLSRADADMLLSDARITSASDDDRVFQHPIYWGAFCYFGA